MIDGPSTSKPFARLRLRTWRSSLAALALVALVIAASLAAARQVAAAAAAGVSVTTTTDEGFAAYKITTPNGIYSYQKQGGGFSSLVDKDGRDWISWNASTGNAGDFRGIPNMVHPSDGGYFHPGRTTATTTLVSKSTSKVTLVSTSADGRWKVQWDVYASHATMTVLRVAGSYWFLYEGTPGGTLDRADYVVRSNGVKNTALSSWTTDIPKEEWAFVADPGLNRSIFLLHQTQDTLVDSYRPSTDQLMTIFGFGRNGNGRYLTQVGDQFSFGLVDSTNLGAVSQAIQTALNQP